MSQSRIHYDHDEVLHALSRAEAQARDASAAHSQARPAMPVSAAGKEFTALAERLQSAFLRVHETGQRRVDVLAQSLAAGTSQVENFTRADEDIAESFQAGQP